MPIEIYLLKLWKEVQKFVTFLLLVNNLLIRPNKNLLSIIKYECCGRLYWCRIAFLDDNLLQQNVLDFKNA